MSHTISFQQAQHIPPPSPLEGPGSPFEQCGSAICESAIYCYPLINRITANWQVVLMTCSTVIAISCVAITFFYGLTTLCIAFAFTAVASGVGTFYMQQYASLKQLEVTVQELNEANERMEGIASGLRDENQRLTETNEKLVRTNDAFQATTSQLQTTNDALKATHNELQTINEALTANNKILTTQVTTLTLQATQLRESATRIRQELTSFQEENGRLQNNVRGFDQSLRTLDSQIEASRALCDQVATHLASQQTGLGDQLAQLSQYLADLRAENRLYERMQLQEKLQQQVLQATRDLGALQVQYATELAKFEAIREALVQVKDQLERTQQNFAVTHKGAVDDLQSNNQQLRDTVVHLTAGYERLKQLFDDVFLRGDKRSRTDLPLSSQNIS